MSSNLLLTDQSRWQLNADYQSFKTLEMDLELWKNCIESLSEDELAQICGGEEPKPVVIYIDGKKVIIYI